MMGRRSGVAAGGKPPASKQVKPAENPKGLKRQQRKPAVTTAGTVGLKKKQVKSKPGFTLYSGNSKVEGSQEPRPAGTGTESLLNGTSKEKNVNKADKMAEAASEIVSQVQLQEDRAKLLHMASLYIPTADAEDSISESDDLIVSTPFNKRLVSSTPDPERLRETELEDELKNLSSEPAASATSNAQEDSLQMIPERDVVTTGAFSIPSDASALTASVAKGLAEKLQLQRELAQPSKSSVSPANPYKPVPPWKQKHQKWKQELQHYKINDQMRDKVLSEEKANAEQSSHNLMTKAEWVRDSILSHSVKKDSSKSSTEGSKSAHVQPLSARKEVSKITADSGINLTDVSTPVISLVKTNVSKSDLRGTSSFWTMPTTLSSFKNKAVTPTVPNYARDFENFKSGILQNSSTNVNKLSPGNDAQSVQAIDATQPIKFHPTSAPTITARSNMATNTSTLTHTATVSSLSPSVKVCETVASPLSLPQTSASFWPETDAALIPKFDVIQDNKIVFEMVENSTDKIKTSKFSDETNPVTLEVSSSSNVITVPTAAYLDSTTSSQESIQDKLIVSLENHKLQNQNVQDLAPDSSHNTSYLSKVITFLKTDGFNAKEKTTKPENITEVTQIKQSQQTQSMSLSNSADDNLREIMSQYLPLATQGETDSVKQALENPKTEPVSDKEIATLQQNLNNRSSAEVDKGDSNQNYNSDDSRYDQPRRKRKSRNLYYLESLADPTLRDIACRLAFKATALRDVELRDLIDDMIFHTDAALGHEDARYQSSNLFLQEENSKLKKRLHNVNRQLDAKERQEKMAATSVYSISNNEMLHVERKMMHLRQEKDRLDAQLTTLLEEKSRWLLTQQDLVKTISLKDHEILKLEEKHQQERIKLHQSLDQATQNSQGVHYKLSVADREISNMEQRLKCRDLDIADLREKLRMAELKTGECQQQVTTKDLEINRLKDMVDTLKLGVDHVLKVYEGGSAGLATTELQRQGIESLYRMTHPERFASSSERTASSYHPLAPQGESGMGSQQPGVFAPPPRLSQVPGAFPQTTDHIARPLPVRPEQSRFSERLQTLENNTSGKNEESYPQRIMSWMQERLQNLTQGQGQNQGDISREKHRSQESWADSRLTAATLERHNQRLSPIDRRLWRSMQETPVEVADEPYYSDSELELNQRESRRLSKRNPKSILKRGKGKTRQRFWQTSTPTREEYYDDQEDGQRSLTPYRSSEFNRKGRPRRKSESDKYTDPRGSRRNSQKSQGDLSKRVLSTSPRERRREMRSRVEETDDEGDDSISDYFKKRSQMPRLPKSPQRGSRDRELQGSHSSKHSTLYSVPIPKSSDSKGRWSQEKSTSRPRSKSLSQDELEEVDIESSSSDSSKINTRGARSPTPREQRWNPARSYSPSSMRKTYKSKKSDRRSRSLEDPPPRQEAEFSRFTRSTSQEQDTRLQTLEPDSDSSNFTSPPRQRGNKSKSHASSRAATSSHFSGQEDGSLSRKGPPQKYFASNAQSSVGTVNGIPSHYATRGSDFPSESRRLHVSDISLSRRATRGENETPGEFFQGTELSSSSLSFIEDDDNNGALGESSNNNQMKSINEDLFSTGIASLDMKIANLQKKIDRAKAIFS